MGAERGEGMKYWYRLNNEGRVVFNENNIIVHVESHMRKYLGKRLIDFPDWILQREEEFTEW
ncbi:MAG TPA: hypothetical protein ENG95_03690 [Nitrospirae bacterium]|nr:hypothetical protein [Nitrospirota bacterium]